MQISFKETSIFYTAQGSGKPLVLLHGFLESSKIWEDFVPSLSKQRQVICIDLPGHGKSGCFNKVHSIEEMAYAVKAVLDCLNTKELTIAGHSMGGYVSLEFSKIFPTITRSLLLINSTPEADSAEKAENRDRASRLVKRNKKAFIKMAINSLLPPEHQVKFQDEIALLIQEAEKMSSKGIIAALQGMKIRTDNTAWFSSFKGDKHMVSGKQDPILDFHHLKGLSKNCNSHFKSFSGGHLSYLENKEALQKYLHFIE